MGKFIFILLMIVLPVSLIVSLFSGSWEDYKTAKKYAIEDGSEVYSWLNQTIWVWKDAFWNGN